MFFLFSMVLQLQSLASLVFLQLDRKWKTVEKFCDHVTSTNRFKEAERVKFSLLSGPKNRKFRSCPIFRTNFFFLICHLVQLSSCGNLSDYPTRPTYLNAKIAPKLTASLRQCVESSSSILNHSKHVYLRSYIYHFQPIGGPYKRVFFPFWKPSCSLAWPSCPTCCSMQHQLKRSLCHDWVCNGHVPCVRRCRPATHGVLRALARCALSSVHGDNVCIYICIHFRPCSHVVPALVWQTCMQIDTLHCIAAALLLASQCAHVHSSRVQACTFRKSWIASILARMHNYCTLRSTKDKKDIEVDRSSCCLLFVGSHSGVTPCVLHGVGSGSVSDKSTIARQEASFNKLVERSEQLRPVTPVGLGAVRCRWVHIRLWTVLHHISW